MIARLLVTLLATSAYVFAHDGPHEFHAWILVCAVMGWLCPIPRGER